MIEKKEILKVARMSKFHLPEDRIEEFGEQLNRIVKILDKLGAVDTTGIDPLYNPLGTKNIFREDVVEECNCKEELIKSSPYNDGDTIVVPKVVG